MKNKKFTNYSDSINSLKKTYHQKCDFRPPLIVKTTVPIQSKSQDAEKFILLSWCWQVMIFRFFTYFTDL